MCYAFATGCPVSEYHATRVCYEVATVCPVLRSGILLPGPPVLRVRRVHSAHYGSMAGLLPAYARARRCPELAYQMMLSRTEMAYQMMLVLCCVRYGCSVYCYEVCSTDTAYQMLLLCDIKY
eukprot:3940926-Rhodomonas_salina.2